MRRWAVLPKLPVPPALSNVLPLNILVYIRLALSQQIVTKAPSLV
jgi:hypothetical protein